MSVGNCLIAALIAKAKHPRRVRLAVARNRSGRWHVAWTDAGVRYEFYAKGRSTMPYWQNLLYIGEIKRVSTP